MGNSLESILSREHSHWRLRQVEALATELKKLYKNHTIDVSLPRAHILMFRSTPQLSNRSSVAKHNPETFPLCAPSNLSNCVRRDKLWTMMAGDEYEKLNTLKKAYRPPSQLPLAIVVREPGFFTKTSTASTWPSRLSTNGFAKILSSFAAFKARVRSRALAKGCINGLRLREVGTGSPGLLGR
jgi:hypothetical protein